MKPYKRNTKFIRTLAVISLLATIYIALYGSLANMMAKNSGAIGMDEIVETMNNFVPAIIETPNPVNAINDGTGTWLMFVLGGWLIAVMYVLNTRKKYIRGKEHGTAEWGEEHHISDLFAENLLELEVIPNIKKSYKTSRRKAADRKKRNQRIKEAKDNYKTDEYRKWANMLLTKTEKASIHTYKLNRNSLIIGGSGSGKTRGYVMPNLLQAHSSYIITDPKGEIHEKSGHFLKQMGYEVRVLNLDIKEKSDYYNPFKYIHPERSGYEERVLMLIETIILNTDGGEKRNSSDPFWEKAERLFLQAIFFFVCDGFPPDEQDMQTVLWLIRQLELEEERDEKNSGLDIYVNNVFAKEHGEGHIGVQLYREFRGKSAGKTAKSIVISAVARLGAPFQTKEMKRILSDDTMYINELGEKKTALFVVVPPTDSTFNFVAGMLFTQIFQELQYCASEKYKDKGKTLPVQVRFILDEFANTCKIPNFVKILAYARSFGIGITVILQSLEQIKEMYKDEWGTILDNCSYLLYLGRVTHIETLEYISKLLGKGTFDKQSSGRTRGRNAGSSTNYDIIGRELMLPDEIRKLDDKNCILIASGRPPFYSEKYDYPSHPRFYMTSDGGAGSFDYKPITELPEPEPEPEPPTPTPKQTQQLTGTTIPVPRLPAPKLIEDETELLQIAKDALLGSNNWKPIETDISSEETPVYSEETFINTAITPISTEKTPINSEETPIITEEIHAQLIEDETTTALTLISDLLNYRPLITIDETTGEATELTEAEEAELTAELEEIAPELLNQLIDAALKKDDTQSAA